MTDKIRAPWTPEQVAALNRFQSESGMHPFTCGNNQHDVSVVLMAHRDGWHCSDPDCDYRQEWAHAFMAEPEAWPKSRLDAPDVTGLADQAGYLRDQLAVLAAQAPVPLPTAEELAAGAAADKVTAARIHAARPGIPQHMVFNVLQALRAVRALDRAPNPDHEDRIPLDQLTEQDLDLLYDDLDRYAEVVGELNEANTELARRAELAEAAVARVRTVEPYQMPVLGDRGRGMQQGWDAALQAVHAALNEPTPAATQATDGWTQQDDGTWTMTVDGGTVLFTRRTTPEERATFAAEWAKRLAPDPDTCRPVEVDGEIVRVRGAQAMTEKEHGYLTEIVRAAKRKYAAEHPQEEQPDA